MDTATPRPRGRQKANILLGQRHPGGLRRLRLGLVLAAIGVGSAPAAEDQGGLRVSGSNTVRLEDYFNRGDRSASPYQSSDEQWYDELDLSLLQRASPYDMRRAQLFAVANQSAYRSKDEGIFVERWRILQEKGDFALPYRIEMGDFFSEVSYRTQSRSLKGGQLEVQPGWRLFDERHSLLLFAGADQPTWTHFHGRRDRSAGASWLMEGTPLGNLGLNYIWNRRKEQDRSTGLSHRRQQVGSLAWEKLLELAKHRLTLEGEIGRFFGDHDAVTATNDGHEESDTGYFGQLLWETPWSVDYRGRYERYGYDYRPFGANVSPDRQSFENHLTCRLPTGVMMRLRQQRYEDGFDSMVETDTDVFGISFSGPLLKPWVPDVSGNFEAFVQYVESDDRTTDNRTFTSTLDLTKPIGRQWSVRPSLFFQHFHDRLAGGGPNVKTVQAQLSVDRVITWGRFRGSISPGIMGRYVRGGSGADTNDVGPSFATQWTGGPHTFGLNLSYLEQHRRRASAVDNEDYNVSATYTYAKGNNTFGAEFEYRGFAPDPGRSSEAYRVSVFWTMSFDFRVPLPGRKRRAEHPLKVGPVASEPGEAPGAELVAQLAPSGLLEDLTREVERRGLRGPAELPYARVYEARLLRRINRRQRLVLAYDKDNNVARIALIIDFQNLGDPDTMAQTFNQVRSRLFRTFGQPVDFIEEGEFTPALRVDIATKRFTRIYEWDTPTGVLRFGIPERLDGQIRIELQHAKRFPGVRQTHWSIEEVR